MHTVHSCVPRALPAISAGPVARLFSTRLTSTDIPWPPNTRECGSTSTAHGKPEMHLDAAGGTEDLAPFNLRMTLDFKQQSDLAYVVSALASPCLPFSQKQGRPVPGGHAPQKDADAQADLLSAMTADRDKWLHHSQDLLVAVKRKGWSTEVQLRAAAAVVSKRADDEALHAKQQLANLRSQFQQHQEVTTSKVQDAFQALLRKQDALRDELRGDMLLEVASACQKHFEHKLHAKSASAAALKRVADWHAEHAVAREAVEARKEAEAMLNEGLANREALYNSHQSLHAEHLALQEHHQALMDSVQQQAATVTSEHQALLLNHKQLLSNFDQLHQQLQDAQSASSALSANLSQAQAERDDLLSLQKAEGGSLLSQSQAEQDRLMRQAQAERDSLFSQLQTQRDSLWNEFQAEQGSTLRELQAVKQQAQQDSQHASSLLQSFAHQQEDATARLAELQQQLATSNSVIAQHESLAQQHEQLQLAFEQERLALVSSKAQHNSLANQHDKLQNAYANQVSSSQSQFADLRHENQQLQLTFEKAQQALTSSKAQDDDLRREKQQLQLALNTSKAALTNAEVWCEDLARAFEKEQMALASSKAQHDSLRHESQQLRLAWNKSQAALTSAKVRCEDLVWELGDLQQKHDNSQIKLAQSEQAVKQHEQLQHAYEKEQQALAGSKAQHDSAVMQLKQRESRGTKISFWEGLGNLDTEGYFDNDAQHQTLGEACQELLERGRPSPSSGRSLLSTAGSCSAHELDLDSACELGSDSALNANSAPSVLHELSGPDPIMLGISDTDSLSKAQHDTLAELKKLQGDLASATSQLQELRAENSSICSENDALHDEIIHHEQHVTKLKPKVKKALKRLQNEVSNLRDRNLQLTQALHSAQQQLSRQKSLSESALRTHEQTFKLKLLEAQQEAQQAQHDMEAPLQELQAAHRESEAYQATLVQGQRAMYQELLHAQQQLQQSQQQLADTNWKLGGFEHLSADQLSKHKVREADLQNQVTELDQMRAQAQQEVADAKHAITEQLNKYSSREEAVQDQVAELEKNLAAVQQELGDTMCELEAADELNHIESENHQVTENRLKNELDALLKEITEVKWKLTEAEERSTGQRDLIMENEYVQEELNYDIRELDKMLDAAEQELADAKLANTDQLSKHESREEASEFEMKELHKELDAAQQELADAKRANTEQLSRQQCRDEELQSQLTKLDQKLAAAEKQLADAKHANTGQLTIQWSREGELQSQVAALEQKRAALMGILTELHRLAGHGEVSAEALLDIFATPIMGEAEAIDSLTHITVKQAIQHSDPVFEPQHAKHAIISNKPPSVAPAMAPAPAHTGPQQGFLGAGQSQAAEDEEEREGDAKASMGRRAAAIQQSMRAHENLTLTAALDIGAAAYASALEGCTMSTQEILLSMLENDTTFRSLLVKESNASARQAWLPCQNTWALSENGIDSWELEVAVAGLLQHAQKLDAAIDPLWADRTDASVQEHWSFSSNPDSHKMYMMVPYTSSPVSDFALRVVYQYWGIPCVPWQA